MCHSVHLGCCLTVFLSRSPDPHLILIGVAELCVHHLYGAALLCVQVEPQLFLPDPVVSGVNLSFSQTLNNRDVVDHVQNQSPQLQLQNSGLYNTKPSESESFLVK